MINRWLLSCLILVIMMVTPLSVSAGIIYDRSPDKTGADILIPNYLNTIEGGLLQWFADRFSLAEAVPLVGIDLFGQTFGSDYVGRAALIRIWADDNNSPGNLLLREMSMITAQDFEGTESKSDLSRHFAPITTLFIPLAGEQYWISMTGAQSPASLSLASFVSSDDNYMWLGRYGDQPRSECDFCGDMAFRLHGEAATTVSLPASVSLMLLGLVLVFGRKWFLVPRL